LALTYKTAFYGVNFFTNDFREKERVHQYLWFPKHSFFHSNPNLEIILTHPCTGKMIYMIKNDLPPHGSTENQFINQLKQHFDQLFLSLDNLRELLFAQIEKTVRKYNANGHKMSNMHSLSRRYMGFASASLNADTLWSPQYLP